MFDRAGSGRRVGAERLAGEGFDSVIRIGGTPEKKATAFRDLGEVYA